MSASKIPKKFRAAKRLEVIYKLGDKFNAYKGNHNGKHKHIQFDDGDQLKYTNIKRNTGRTLLSSSFSIEKESPHSKKKHAFNLLASVFSSTL